MEEEPLFKGLAGVAALGIRGRASQLPYIALEIGNFQIKALIDSGSARSFISTALCDRLTKAGSIKGVENTDFNCVTASKTPLNVSSVVSVKFKVEGFSWLWKFLSARELAVDCILGSDFLGKSGFVVDVQSGHGYFKFNRRVLVPLDGSISPVNCIQDDSSAEAKDDKRSLGHLTPEQAQQIEELCARYPEVLTPKLGVTDLMEYEIRLKDKQPVRSYPYDLAPPKAQIMRDILQELWKEQVIEKSNSSYASPAFLVPKPDGSSRLVIDYRKLNQRIEIDSVPLPNLQSAFDWFGEACYFTIIDLNKAYHQIPLKPESKPLTSFCVPWDLLQFKRLPMGIAVGAQTLTRLIDLVFHDVKFKYVFSYLDDLCVFSKTFDEHLAHLNEVLVRLKRAGLTCNPSKVKFAQPEVSFLGHLVSSKGVCIDPDRTQAIRDFPPPKDVKGIARFLGMINFYRKFIPNVAELAAPLNQLRKSGVKFKWGEDQQRSFEILKEKIIQPPVLRMPDFSREFILQTDASSYAIGAVLSQEFDGVRQPIAFASRTLTDQEKKASSVYELECLAVVFGTDKFRRYLEHSEFLLETDNQALSWLLSHPRQLGKIGRWVVKISAFKFRTQHIRGTQNLIADTLSRMFHTNEKAVDNEPVVNTILADFPLAFGGIKNYQAQDEVLGPILKILQEGGKHDPYFLVKDVLCCRTRRGKRPCVVLPSVLIPMVFEYYHSSQIGAHLGIYKTINKIRREFLWKGMDKDIAERVRSCVTCSLSKPAQNTQLGFLSSDVASRPMEKVFIDFVGPLPRSKCGNTMLLVCVDSFSKFCWLYPLKRATAKNTINILQGALFQHFGIPKIIVSDNGSQFKSRDFHRMCFNAGIKHVTTSPYYPQPSHAERFNRNLRSALIAFHSGHQDTWDESLRWLQLAFNSAKHESHRTTPFELVFGQPPNNPLANLWTLEDLLPSETGVDLVANWSAARRNLLKAHKRLRDRYNKGRVDNPFKEGDMVFCKIHPTSSAVERRAAKLCYRWSGPLRIARFLSPVTALLVDPRTGATWRRAHISHLKPFRGKWQGDTTHLDPGGSKDAAV